MSTDVLTLTQLLSPSFPVGAFAYSHGLEAAIDAGLVGDGLSLQDWLETLVSQGSAYSDAVFLNAAYAAPRPEVAAIDMQARAFAASRERLLESDLQGAAFCDTLADVWGLELGRLTYPVAVGRAASELDIDPHLTTALYLQAFVGNLCAAAMRLVPLGQTGGQLVQAALKPLCLSVAERTKGAILADLYANSFLSDIMAMRHEKQYARVFRS
ncbi:Urease accessory protein UreF [Sulfitobacter noctilucicola]|uniref:Urease accessory protein UreF n=1 Tax=Sulfitobacter noctilucicola TaxID=1342301 RepID=A0A7W6MBQ7_9RHOB|nr:urease accessory UreF family protein [Sulfitobacter noctilucicola]KIN63934.1 Urease accessory protein UreF [Sulfitobacter noctilucicola]MBB4175292.1 urease accessory protein [Sulfitobacter noctilucicola]